MFIEKNVMLFKEEKTRLLIRCFYYVYNRLGYGFLEKVYENALLLELKKAGFHCQKQVPVEVYYQGSSVGYYISDIIVDNEFILEIKAGKGEIMVAHEKQLANYLKATNIEIGLLFHFGEKPSFKRQVFHNRFKNHRSDPLNPSNP